MGNRIYKSSRVAAVTKNTEYIVDIAGQLPTIICEIKVETVGETTTRSLKNSYIYDGNAQVLCQIQHGLDLDENGLPDKYFYLHDRLGSVRLMINEDAEVANSYTYDPYGSDLTAECVETAYNPFKYTSQWYDAEINQYYLRARMYDPQLMRFTDRDPVDGEYEEPLTLHKYLYTANDPINRIDPSGEFYANIASGLEAMATVYAAGINIATIGAEDNIFELIEVGAFITQLSKVAFVVGMAMPGAGGRPSDIIQSRGHTLRNSTLRELGMTRDQGKKAIEALKKYWGYPNNYHGKIGKDGGFYDDAFNFIDNLWNFID